MDNGHNLFKYEIVHINVRSARSNKLNLEAYLSEMKFPEIICLNETKLPKDGNFKIDGYNISSRREHSALGGSRGSMILTREDIKNVVEVDEVKDMFRFDEIIGIEILKSALQPGIKIFTYYNPPLSSPNQAVLQYISSVQGGCVLTGDLNCKNTHWGSSKNEKRGVELLDTLNRLNLVTFNDDSKTRCDPVTGKEDSLDIIIGNLESARLLKEFWVGYDLGSDHYPVHATLQFKEPTSLPSIQVRRAEKMNTARWNKLLKKQPPLRRAATAADLEKNAETLTSRIKSAFEQCCPLTTIKRKSKCKFTPEIEARVKEKRKLRRDKNDALQSQNLVLARDIMTRMNKIGNEIKRLQKTAQRAELERHCHNLNKETNAKKFFDTFGLLSKPILQENQSCSLPRPLEDELGNRASNSQDKADLFANRLQRIHQEPNYAGFDDNWKESVESFIDNHEQAFKEKSHETYDQEEPGDDSFLCQEVKIDELEANLAKGKNRSAVGHDGITLSKNYQKKQKQTYAASSPTQFGLDTFLNYGRWRWSK